MLSANRYSVLLLNLSSLQLMLGYRCVILSDIFVLQIMFVVFFIEFGRNQVYFVIDLVLQIIFVVIQLPLLVLRLNAHCQIFVNLPVTNDITIEFILAMFNLVYTNQKLRKTLC